MGLKNLIAKLPNIPKRKTVKNMNYDSLKGSARNMQFLDRDIKKLEDYARLIKDILKDMDKLDAKRSKLEESSKEYKELTKTWKEHDQKIRDYYDSCVDLNKNIEKYLGDFFEGYFVGYYGSLGGQESD